MKKSTITHSKLTSAALAVAACSFLGAAYGAQFKDATAIVKKPTNVFISDKTFIGPFATLIAGKNGDQFIEIGEGSNVQDSCILNASKGSVEIGEGVIIAHGANVLGAKYIETSIGIYGPGTVEDPNTVEHEATTHCFVSFNAKVQGAILERGSIVSALAWVGPYVYLESGLKVLPGKHVARQSDVAGATVPVTAADVLFMEGVIEVNEAFAEHWPDVVADDPNDGLGIGPDPDTAFNPGSQIPTFAGTALKDPKFKGKRIIGEVEMADTVKVLGKVMGPGSSLRADEGAPFIVGHIKRMGKNVTFHALEDTHIEVGDAGTYGTRSIIHGGPTPFGDTSNTLTHNVTKTGTGFKLGDGSVFFRSRAGDNVIVGKRSVVQQSDLADGTVIPDKEIWLNGVKFGNVEW